MGPRRHAEPFQSIHFLGVRHDRRPTCYQDAPTAAPFFAGIIGLEGDEALLLRGDQL